MSWTDDIPLGIRLQDEANYRQWQLLNDYRVVPQSLLSVASVVVDQFKWQASTARESIVRQRTLGTVTKDPWKSGFLIGMASQAEHSVEVIERLTHQLEVAIEEMKKCKTPADLGRHGRF